jgi:hypothetical protein
VSEPIFAMHSRALLPALTLAVTLCLLPGDGAAQLYERASGSHTVRANVIGSLFLEPAIAREHAIVPSRDRAILNVIVVPTGAAASGGVPAKVDARVTPAGQTSRTVPMREVAVEGSVSYLGTFEFLPGRSVEVNLAVQPAGASQTIEMHFVDDLPPR